MTRLPRIAFVSLALLASFAPLRAQGATVSPMPWTLAVILALHQQQPSSPGLQHRSTAAPVADDQPVTVVHEPGKNILPDDAFGLYRFADREGPFGEGLQITYQFDQISGYFSVSAGANTHGKVLTYFLIRVTGGDGHLTWETRQVHGISYSFEGKVMRGQGLTRAQDGFYLMDGALTTHDDVERTTQNRTVTFKLIGQH